ncbi:MAG TPA: hypothetical protein VL128_10545 [Candidatus Eisenbacteria bacterium]|nr:hypothetical protein [Candidatus Eisenbacteria bacterium]
MNQPVKRGISRRQFATRAALLSATATVAPTANVFAQTAPATAPRQSAEPHPNLSAASQTEAEARLQLILSQYGSRFTDDEKKLLERLNFATQESLDHVRAYALQNGDAPALYLKPLVERPKQKSSTPAASPAKKS